MNYRQARDYLYRQKGRNIKLGLRNVEMLLDHLGNPHRDHPSVHVGGTNGKGSVCAILSSCTWRAGESWGMFTSPHLVELVERFRIADAEITKKELTEIFHEIKPYLDQHEGKDTLPSFFEIMTALASRYFSRNDVDGGIYEVGLGGRLDATNLVKSEISVITTIGKDHTKALGETVESRAYEKAGIIKPDVPVVVGDLPEKALEVVKNKCRETGSEIVFDKDLVNVEIKEMNPRRSLVHLETPWGEGETDFPLVGRHQADNLKTALAVLWLLSENGRHYDFDRIIEGIRMTNWPGRMDLRGVFLFDITHNREGSDRLVETMNDLDLVPADMVIGILERKHHEEILARFAKVSRNVIFTRTSWDDGADPEKLASLFKNLPSLHEGEVLSAGTIPQAMEMTGGLASPVLVTGSLFTVGEAMKYLGIEKPPISPERLMLELKEAVSNDAYLGEHSRDQTPFQVLISTVLSQRTRDENTKKASDALFAKAGTPEAILELDDDELRNLIRPAGFYNQKAKALKKISQRLLDAYGGEVPDDIEKLVELPHVGRKTANCVLVYAHGRDALPVDTHVHRITNLIGMVDARTPESTEEALKEWMPKKYWKEVNGLLVRFGQTVCVPTSPRCRSCRLRTFCNAADTEKGRS